MKIIKTKYIVAKEVSEIPETLAIFKNRKKLHEGSKPPKFFVYIHDLAWNAFINHGNRVYNEIKHEAQGIFIGHYYKDTFGEFVVATIYEESTGNSQSAYVEMSEECLAKISEKCQNDDALMLIWVHTHPNMSVSFSRTDNNCLKTNFYKHYQIGLVVDILNDQIKGYRTKGTDVVEYSDYILFDNDKNRLYPPYSPKIKIIRESDKLKTKIEFLEQENDALKKKLQVLSSRGRERKTIKDRRCRRR